MTVIVNSRKLLTLVPKDCTRFWNTPTRNTVAVTLNWMRMIHDILYLLSDVHGTAAQSLALTSPMLLPSAENVAALKERRTDFIAM